MIDTYAEAYRTLEEDTQSVTEDMGEETVEAGWHDIVTNVASRCTPEVAAELIRRNT